MKTDVDTCHQCKQPQCDWTMARCSKGMYCRECFCFKCLSQLYPKMYNSVYRGFCWTCPACLGACNCEECTDPVKKQERQEVACAKYKQAQSLIAVQQSENKQAAESRAPPLVPATYNNTRSRQRSTDLLEEDSQWPCPRCSVINSADEIECNACCFHRKRTSRKRTLYAESPSYEEKHYVQKVTKRARDINYDEKSPPARGRVSALRQLVKNPWTDGWDFGRRLALDLVEEAKQIAIKQGLPVSQVRQLPTKFQLANTRGTHVRKWFDREPTLGKKFLRAAGLICSKSNGTFIREDIPSIDHLPDLIRKADLSHYDEASAYSGDDMDDASSSLRGSSTSVGSSPSSSPPLSPHTRSAEYQPKLKVYYHHSDEDQPFVFKVPITDLKTIDELQERLGMLLREMGQPVADSKKPLVLSTGNKDYVTETPLPCATIDDIARCSLIHVHAH